MLIAISGTPGTGKSAAAKELRRMLKARLITVSFLAKKYKIKTSFDKKRRTKIIDTRKLAAAIKKDAKASDMVIFESHLAHFVPSGLVIVLRTSPKVLEKRLRKKKWRRQKIMENVEAEALGIISSETKRAVEIDTTKKTSKQTAVLIVKILKSKSPGRKYGKRIDWSEEYTKYLKKN